MIRVVLFDLGGILIELTGVSIFRSWIGDRVTPEEIWRLWLTSPTVRAFETGRISADVFADRLIREFGLPLDRDQFLTSFAAWPRPFPQAADLVRRVHQRYTRATLCNTNVLHWSRLRDEMGLEQLFEYHFASHLMGKLKPDRDVFEHVITTLGCEPAEILFLDDQPLNVESARLVGVQAIRANGLLEAEQVLAQFGVIAAARDQSHEQ